MRAEPSWTLPAPLSALPEEIPGSQSPALSSFLLRLPVLTLGSRVSSTSADPLYSRSRCFLFVPIRNQRCVSVLMTGGGRSSAGDVFSCRHFSALAGADHKLESFNSRFFFKLVLIFVFDVVLFFTIPLFISSTTLPHPIHNSTSMQH